MIKNLFSKKNTLAIAMTAALGLASGSAFALITALEDNINSFDVLLANNQWLDNINQLNWTGYDLSVFDDGDNPGVAGSVSTDYILLNLQTATTATNATQTLCLNSTCEVTLFVKTRAVQTDAIGNFQFTELLDFQMFSDTLTAANLGSDGAEDLARYFNGTKVLTGGGLASLTGTNPIANTGQINPGAGAGGSFNFQNQVLETAVDFLFESGAKNSLGTNSLFDSVAPAGIFLMTEGQTTIQVSQAGATVIAVDNDQLSVFNNFKTYFGLNNANNLSLSLIQSSPTTNVASKIPEPATLALLGMGLLGASAARRRRAAA